MKDRSRKEQNFTGIKRCPDADTKTGPNPSWRSSPPFPGAPGNHSQQHSTSEICGIIQRDWHVERWISRDSFQGLNPQLIWFDFIYKIQLMMERKLLCCTIPPGVRNLKVVPGSLSLKISSCLAQSRQRWNNPAHGNLILWFTQVNTWQDWNCDRAKDYTVCIPDWIYFIQELLQIFLNFNVKKGIYVHKMLLRAGSGFLLMFSGILRLNHWFLSIYCCFLFPARAVALEQPQTLELILPGENISSVLSITSEIWFYLPA